MADVFAFRGRAYYDKPGWQFRPAEVQEDFSAWRATKSQDGKAVADWLVKNGFRMVYRSFSKGTEARDYREWWALVKLVGEEGIIEPHQLRSIAVGVSSNVPTEDQWEELMDALPKGNACSEEDTGWWSHSEWACSCTLTLSGCGDEHHIRLCASHATSTYKLLI